MKCYNSDMEKCGLYFEELNSKSITNIFNTPINLWHINENNDYNNDNI